MKIIGFNAGQYGDLVMNTVACRAAKQQWPDCYLTLGIGKPFEEIAPLFKNHPHIDDIHIWESYNGLTDGDKKYIDEQKFDKVFNPMPYHKNLNWYNEVDCQTAEVCRMHDLEPPEDLSCYLEKYFFPRQLSWDFICISPFTAHEPKNMDMTRWIQIIKYIKNKGIDVCQLSSPNDPQLFGTFINSDRSYFGSVKALLASRFLITLDGGLNWVSSAYKHPTLGLMGRHYPNQISSKSYQPINLNAQYLEAAHANDIEMELVFEKINEMLK